jgi:hypothetical protein
VSVRELSWDEVIRAGTVIFGPTFAATVHAGGWRDDLKRAYRRRVLETHPDRAVTLGRPEVELLREFRAVSAAYELLVELRAGSLPSPQPSSAPRPPSRPARAARGSPSRRTWRNADGVTPPAGGRGAGGRGAAEPPRPGWRTAGLPRRRLRIAEFLYYSGRVGWQDFVGAIAWQRAQRPAVGRIAVSFGYLEVSDVTDILERRRREGVTREPFGEYAVRHGYLSPYQLLAMLGQQLRLQRPIGRYFAERGLLSDVELEEARVAVLRHNARHAA